MDELTDDQIAAAERRGRAVRASEPRAKAVRFDINSGRMVVDLTNGATFAFPPALIEGLSNATQAEIADVALIGDGYGLHWSALDIDISVPGLLAGIFGTRAHMARMAGLGASPAKAAAARANGAKGGRPRKSA